MDIKRSGSHPSGKGPADSADHRTVNTPTVEPVYVRKESIRE